LFHSGQYQGSRQVQTRRQDVRNAGWGHCTFHVQRDELREEIDN
jgi:hypothetical protein